MNPNPYLVASSLVLSFPAIALLYKRELLAGLWCMSLCVSSTLWHATKPRYPTLLTVDLFLVYMNMTIASFMSFRGLPYSLAPLSLLVVSGNVLYHFGRYYRCFAWDSDCTVATRWHMILHMIPSFGYLWIIALSKP